MPEYLTPRHPASFHFPAAKGHFVLGGLQALYGTELDHWLGAVMKGEHRCPLDPGCSRGSGACSACLHVGDPSCRSYNTYLDRNALTGPLGYLTF